MSDEAIWKAVDHFAAASLIPEDPILDGVLKANKLASLPEIDVSPTQGALLSLLVRIHGAKKILEIGTLGGYSSIWMARALPSGGKLITIEYDPHHAKTAPANIVRAGLGDVVDLRVGRALGVLPELSGEAPFDFIFIDADKPNNGGYIEWAIKLGRRGTVIVVDNVVRDGQVIQEYSEDRNVRGARDAFKALGEAGTFEIATAVQTVGAKGYDGFAIAILK
jgi:predicted O-methyltransferase YrrM